MDRLAGHYRDRQPDLAFEELGEKREPIHHGHLKIGEDRFHVLRAEELERVSPMLSRDDGKSSSAIERPAQCIAHKIVIVHEEKVRHWLQHSRTASTVVN